MITLLVYWTQKQDATIVRQEAEHYFEETGIIVH